MLLGIKSVKTVLLRHIIMGAVTFGIWFFFISLPSNWSPDMRVWRVAGDTGFVLLFLILIIGPMAKLWAPLQWFMSWRRELGIWFAAILLLHAYLVFDGWFQWDLMRMLGYQYIPQTESWSRVEPGFGLANIIGLIAGFWAVVLAVTSSDKAVTYLGVDSWKWLHNSVNVIFYLTAAHVGYYLFIQYTLSSHKGAYEPNILQWPFLIMAITVFVLQVIVFIRTVAKNRKKDWY